MQPSLNLFNWSKTLKGLFNSPSENVTYGFFIIFIILSYFIILFKEMKEYSYNNIKFIIIIQHKNRGAAGVEKMVGSML